MIYTSYFAKLKKLPETITPISICGKAPDWYTGLQYKVLAPKYWFFQKYKQDGDECFYTEQFNKEVLSLLQVNAVVDTLRSMAGTEDIALICYEKPSDFCHRHLVAKWLTDHGASCTEWEG